MGTNTKINSRANFEDGRRWTGPIQQARFTTSIEQWALEMIEGRGGMNDFEFYEIAIPECSDRTAAALWVLRCLGNNLDENTEQVFQAIAARRNELRKHKEVA